MAWDRAECEQGHEQGRREHAAMDARGCGEERGEEEKDTSKLDATRLITVSIIVVMVMVNMDIYKE